MKKAKIEITMSKKGKFVATIHFDDGKSMPLVGFSVEKDLNGRDCEVERIEGKIVNVYIDGKQLEKIDKNLKTPNKQIRNFNDKHYGNNKRENDKADKIGQAYAPYNFIPLNDKVVTVNTPKPFNEYYDDHNTGYIDIEVETKTPIFIRGEGSEFYKQAGKYRIPGSSLRGMVRTMVEMVSWSEFSFFNNDYLYYRSFADKSRSLRDEYMKHMISSDSRGKFQYRMNSGLLYKEGLYYYIIPAKKRFEKIKKSESKKYSNYPGYYGFVKLSNDKYLVVPGKKFKPIDEKNQNDWIVYADSNASDKRLKISNDDIFSYKNDSNRKSPDIISKIKKTGFVPCFYVEWKDLKGNKRISFGHTPLFRISYEKNIGEHITQNRPEGIDIAVSIFGNENDGSPLFSVEDILEWEDILKSLKEHKTPDKKRIWELLNRNSKKVIEKWKGGEIFNENSKQLVINGLNEIIKNKDFYTDEAFNNIKLPNEAKNISNKGIRNLDESEVQRFNRFLFESIYPYEIAKIQNDFMTRLFFEDAFLLDNFLDKVSEKEKIPKTLSGPKPTSFQLYLEQENVNNVNNLKHYNNDVNIRGNKLYWHKRSSNAWKNNFNPNIDTKIKPIATGAKFHGRIRFENLSDIELGALLFSIDLPEGLAHKIGMAKPLGLGSIRITPKLYLSDRKKRYSDILAEWEGLENSNKIKELKQTFEEFILNEIGESEKESLWDTDRLKELARMLDFENRPSNNITEYMELEEFREREVLPKPTDLNNN